MFWFYNNNNLVNTIFATFCEKNSEAKLLPLLTDDNQKAISLALQKTNNLETGIELAAKNLRPAVFYKIMAIGDRDAIKLYAASFDSESKIKIALKKIYEFQLVSNVAKLDRVLNILKEILDDKLKQLISEMKDVGFKHDSELKKLSQEFWKINAYINYNENDYLVSFDFLAATPKVMEEQVLLHYLDVIKEDGDSIVDIVYTDPRKLELMQTITGLIHKAESVEEKLEITNKALTNKKLLGGQFERALKFMRIYYSKWLVGVEMTTLAQPYNNSCSEIKFEKRG